MTPLARIQRQHGIVGREAELALALAVLEAGRHLLLEGPVGVGKTTLALAVCGWLGTDTVRVDGDDRYSEARLTGWFDPPLVLEAGYGEQSFSPGPLVEAMRRGAVLFINELNRMPETVQNVLLPALDERRIGVPHIGEVRAAPGFRVVATQNPVEYVATGHLSEALRDRFEHLALDYQSAEEELAIVLAETRTSPELAAATVRMVRATRTHARLRKGASVRAAIATVQLAERLTTDPSGDVDRSVLRRAAAAALRTRVDLRDDVDADFRAVLEDVLAAALGGAEAVPAIVAKIQQLGDEPYFSHCRAVAEALRLLR
ncbi:MAG: MoxR family ATPase, partial [Chloroflexota bacterium]